MSDEQPYIESARIHNMPILPNPNIEVLHIGLLSEQLDLLYQATREEQIAIARWEEDQNFSILGVIELFATEIQGYVEQIRLNHFVDPIVQSVNYLRQLNVFKIDYFAKWYMDNWEKYPQTKQYIDQLDHLRLLVLEYFNHQSSMAA
jgi:hypothetical protein